MSRDAAAPEVGGQAPDLELLDEKGRPIELSALAQRGPLLTLVFRHPDDAESLRMLLDYRDATLGLRKAGVSICAVGRADPGALAFMRMQRGLGFPVLADADGTALPKWGMADQVGLLLLDRRMRVRQRALGARGSAESMLAFVRRGTGLRPDLRDRIAQLFHSLAHALRPRRFAR